MSPEWKPNLKLPRLPSCHPLEPPVSYPNNQLEIENVVAAIQHGESSDMILKHLAYYSQKDDTKLRKKINSDVKGFPAIFYIVETDNLEMIRCWVKYGGDVNATCGREQVPLLAFTILQKRSTRTLEQATRTLELLLSLGASASVIPREFHTQPNGMLQWPGPVDRETSDIIDAETRWCKGNLRKELDSALNQTQRYRLAQATRAGLPTQRQKTVVLRANAEPILGVRYTVVGQDATTEMLQQSLMA